MCISINSLLTIKLLKKIAEASGSLSSCITTWRHINIYSLHKLYKEQGAKVQCRVHDRSEHIARINSDNIKPILLPIFESGTFSFSLGKQIPALDSKVNSKFTATVEAKGTKCSKLVRNLTLILKFIPSLPYSILSQTSKTHPSPGHRATLGSPARQQWMTHRQPA